jgi:hypothetical protein
MIGNDEKTDWISMSTIKISIWTLFVAVVRLFVCPGIISTHSRIEWMHLEIVLCFGLSLTCRPLPNGFSINIKMTE